MPGHDAADVHATLVSACVICLVDRDGAVLRTLDIADARSLHSELNAALAEHTRRNPPPLRDDTAGFGIGDPRRGRW